MPEKRILLKQIDESGLGDIQSYEKRGGFEALKKALAMQPEAVLAEVKASGLQGRGGAGFPCGVKWELARQASGDQKYLICNADEGEVGTFKDRYILKHGPFILIEGMAICAHTIGASKTYIYLRQEYRNLLVSLQTAIEQSRTEGYLEGFDIQIQEGAGAYICGEESALMNSIEGHRGESRYRPPFPPISGLFSCPTIINNVETLAFLPLIIQKGADWYSALGTDKSKGTKLFCVSGDVDRPGVYEMEMGCSLRELVEDLAGARDIGWVQVGGSTGGIIPNSELDTKLAYETIIGSGAVIVFNQQRDIIDFVYRTIEFLNEESCGKCTPCREGTEVILEILDRLLNGEGVQSDIQNLMTVSKAMKLASLCGLGQTAAVPVLDTLKHYKKEYENRISQAELLLNLQPL